MFLTLETFPRQSDAVGLAMAALCNMRAFHARHGCRALRAAIPVCVFLRCGSCLGLCAAREELPLQPVLMQAGCCVLYGLLLNLFCRQLTKVPTRGRYKRSNLHSFRPLETSQKVPANQLHFKARNKSLHPPAKSGFYNNGFTRFLVAFSKYYYGGFGSPNCLTAAH